MYVCMYVCMYVRNVLLYACTYLLMHLCVVNTRVRCSPGGAEGGEVLEGCRHVGRRCRRLHSVSYTFTHNVDADRQTH